MLAVTVVGVSLRLGVACRDLDILDRLFVPDDTYYTLAIARSLAAGLGPSADGMHLTNGFQPLLAFMLVPVFWCSGAPELPLFATLVIGSLADGATMVLLARLAQRYVGTRAAVLAALFWATSPVAFTNALCGLETSLAVATSLWLVDVWTLARTRSRPTMGFVYAGAVAGVCLLARVDTCFLIAALALLEIARSNRRAVTLAGVAALVVVAPWWVWSFLEFGTFVPESGSAVRFQTQLHQALYLDMPRQLAFSLGHVIGPPFFDLPGFRGWSFEHFGIAGPCMAVALVSIAFVTFALYRRRCRDAVGPVALALYALTITLFYTLYVPALWFFSRYFAPVHAVLGLGYACVLSRLPTTTWSGRIVALATGLLVSFGVISCLSLFVYTPPQSLRTGLDGAKGYGEVARDVLGVLPAGSVVGALQSGALAYYAPSDITVVNLDGVVDRAAAAAFRERRLSEFAQARGVTHIADWSFNINAFMWGSSSSATTAVPTLVPIGMARPQGGDRFVVMDVRWGPRP